MLAGVSCKDYYDDIDDLKGQINDLKGQVELKADASALKAVTDKLNGIDFSSFVTNSGLQTELDKRLADYAKKSDLKDWLTNDEVLKLIQAQGYQTKADVQKLIDETTKNQLTADDVKKIFETMIASDETMGKLQAEMQKIIQQALVDGKYVTEQQMKDFVEGKGYITGADQLSATQINQILTAVAAHSHHVFLTQMQSAGQIYREGGVAAGVVEQPPPVAEHGRVMGNSTKGEQNSAACPLSGCKKLPPVAAQTLVFIFVAVIVGQHPHSVGDAHRFQFQSALRPHQCRVEPGREQPAFVPIVVFHTRVSILLKSLYIL